MLTICKILVKKSAWQLGKIEVYSVAKSKSLRLGSSTMPVTVIYYHSVINKAMIPTGKR